MAIPTPKLPQTLFLLGIMAPDIHGESHNPPAATPWLPGRVGDVLESHPGLLPSPFPSQTERRVTPEQTATIRHKIHEK